MSKYTRSQLEAYRDIRASIVGKRIFAASVVGLVFVLLKAFGQINWAWWVVTSPFWGSAAYFVLALIGITIFWLAAS